MNMNLFAKAAEFEKLCHLLVKKAQTVDPNKPFVFRQQIPPASLSGPTPHYSAPAYSPEIPTVSVNSLPDANKPKPKATEYSSLQIALNKLSTDLIDFKPEQHPGVSLDAAALKSAGNSLYIASKFNKPADMLKALQSILNLTRNGGGDLYETAKNLFSQVQQVMPKVKEKPAPWLNQYMADQKLKDQADDYQAGMQASLDKGHSVQDAMNRSNVPPSFPR